MRKLDDVIDIVRKTLTKKGDMYGPTYRRVAVMLSVQPQYSIMVRILEKIARIHNILQINKNQSQLQEEFIDIACYAVLAAFESDNHNSEDCSIVSNKD